MVVVDYIIVSNSSPLPLSYILLCYPSDVGLGHLTSFGQWKVVGRDSAVMLSCIAGLLGGIAASAQHGAFLSRTRGIPLPIL